MVPWAAGTWSPPMTTAVGKAGGDRLGLGLGQPHGPCPRRFPGDFGLIDLRTAGAEGQAEALQQGGAITGGGCQDQGA